MAQARHSGRCLDIYAWSQGDGTRVIQYDCHGGANQRFDYNANNKTISVKHSNKCLTVKSADAWQQVVQQPCVGSWNQKWDLNDDGSITLSGTKMTMDVKYADGGNLADVIIWPKNGGNNQKFNKLP
jgi:alpha-galactosidase